RTLWSIIETCLATIFACVVTSIHPNIPGPEDGRWRKNYRLTGVILLGVFAPELVVTWAGRQFVCARSFTKKMNDLIQSHNKAQGIGSWTLTHSFFAYMGGFMLYRGSERCGIVTAQHIHAELKRSPPRIGPIDITKEEINDMSKLNVLSKGVAIIQILWFVTQLIARNALSFSITPLEIGTMAFGLLSVLTYVLWMCKPYQAK
ncbi:hypothetical protein CONPUDRAFT_18021, partial [Coniophora puteana RWD-64-598 SS2]